MIKLYPKMSQSMRDFLFTYAMRDITPIFEVGVDGHRPCGAEDFDKFLACFDKDNRYKVTARGFGEEKTVEAYLHNGRYYTSDIRYLAEEYITKIEKIDNGKEELHQQHHSGSQQCA